MRAWTKDDYITPPWFLDLVRKVFPEGLVADLAWDNPWYEMPPWMGAGDMAPQGQNFCNPPYSNIGPWIEKAFRIHNDGDSVLLLLPANTDTKWFHRLAERATLCFWKGRIKFLKPKRVEIWLTGEAPYPDTSLLPSYELVEDPSPRHLPLVAFLPRNVEDEQRFTEVFQSYGTIL